MKREDLHAERVLSGEVCGTTGEWKRSCIRTSAEVEQLGGFGLLIATEGIDYLLTPGFAAEKTGQTRGFAASSQTGQLNHE